MAVTREVRTEVRCDRCGRYIAGWSSTKDGVSKGWAAYFARQEGASVGKAVKCRQCRMQERMGRCSLCRERGIPEQEKGIALALLGKRGAGGA